MNKLNAKYILKTTKANLKMPFPLKNTGTLRLAYCLWQSYFINTATNHYLIT
ncbi:MAG: hypothetical protein RR618_01400 [Cellulosilyticaceae bacterium]